MSRLRRAADAVLLVRPALRAERASSLLLFALVLISCALAAAVPILAQRSSEAGLLHAVRNASSVERNLAFSQRTHKLIDQAGDPLAAVERAADELAQALPPSIAGAVVERQYVIDTALYLARRAPQPVTHLVLRHQTGVEPHISYVEGRPPTGAIVLRECPDPDDCDVTNTAAVTYEVALSRNTADALQLAVGDTIVLGLDGGSPRPRPGGPPPSPGDFGLIGAHVTGIFEIEDPYADYWLGDSSLHVPNVQPVTIDLANYYAAALVAAETYAELPALISYTYSWRFRLGPQAIEAGGLEQFDRDLRRLQAQYPVRAPGSTVDAPSLATGLSAVIDRYGRQRSAAQATLNVMGIGPLIAVLGSLGLVIALWLQRREAALVYMRQRGAASSVVVARVLAEAVLLIVPAAALGYVLAGIALGTFSTGALLVVVIVSALSLALVLLAAIPIARSALGAGRDDQLGPRRVPLRRLIFEALLVTLALVGAIALSEREPGVAGDVDPYLAAVPALAGIAVGVALLRLYPLAARAAAWVAGRARGLVGAHALRTAAREPGLARLPLLALLLAATLTVFAGAVLVTLERAQLASTWRQLGADYRIDADLGDVIPSELLPGELPGVSVATRSLDIEAAVSGARLRRDGVLLQAVAPAEYEALLAGTPVEVELPPTFSGAWPHPGHAAEPTVGFDDAPLPAVVFERLAGEAGLAIGETFEIVIPGGRAVARVDALWRALPGFDAAREFLLVPYDALRAAYPDRPLPPTLLLIRGEPSVEPALREMVEPFQRRVSMDSRPELYVELHDAPLSRAIAGGLGLALAVALGYGALALVASAALALVARRREMALLRTIGARRRQLVALLLVGQIPGVLAALGTGIALGLALSVLLLPALGLDAFSGPQVAITLQLEPLHVVLAALLPAIVALCLAVAGGWLLARGELAAIIRAGEAQVARR